MLELADIDIERDAAQAALIERLGECVLVDDLAARDIGQDAALFHQGETVLVEEPGRLGRPLAADRDDIGIGQKAVELGGAAEFAEALRQWLAPLRRGAAGADDPHAERGAELADIEPDAAGADNEGRLALDHQWPVGT